MLNLKIGYSTVSCQIKKSYMEKLMNQHNNKKWRTDNWNEAKSFDMIPGPKPMPVIGNVWRFFPYVGNYYGLYANEQHQRFHEEFGDIVKLSSLLLLKDFVFVYNPKDIETVFRNDSPWPIRMGLESLRYYRLNTRNNIFKGCGGTATSHGEDWYNIRTVVNQPLMRNESILKYIPVINEVANDFIARTNHLLEMSPYKNQLPDNYNLEIFKWAFESIAAITLNSRLGALENNLDGSSKEHKMLNAVFELFPLMYKLDMLPSLWKLYPTKNWIKYVKNFDIITNECIEFIQKSLKSIKSRSNSESSKNSILEILLEKDEKIALAMSIDLLLGGTETTSETMASTLYYLSVNKQVQDKLREEIFKLAPEKDKEIDKDLLDKFKYLKAVLKESMRLAPVAIATLRAAGRDMVLSGFQIPKGTNLINCHIVLCQSEKYFPQAKTFIPERWMDFEGQNPYMYKNKNPFVSLPFGFGPRSCVGRRLSEIEMEILIIKVTQDTGG